MKHKLLVGKYTLESLTSGLYISPLDLYREYVQNAADSIDQAVEKEILDSGYGQIVIDVNPAEGSIQIQDNGCGVGDNEIESTLIDIGNSTKMHSTNRGFRGIGRLSGLGYCKRLEFVTSKQGEQIETSLCFDAEKLLQLLSPQQGAHESVEDVFNQIITIEKHSVPKNTHYFKVKLDGIDKNSLLLDNSRVVSYLQQNLPIPFSPNFVWGQLLKDKLQQKGFQICEYKIDYIYEGKRTQLFKPNDNYILSDRVRKIEDPISEIRFKEFDIDGKPSAFLWYAETNFYGTILNKEIKGIRVRQGNIMIGDGSILRKHFREERFNGWLVGELHIVDPYIIPNTRRDDFEQTDHYKEFISQFVEWTSGVTKGIRHKSYQRSLSNKENVFMVSTPSKKAIDEIASEADIGGYSELTYGDTDNSEDLAREDLLSKLHVLMGMGNKITKYNVLNVNQNMTTEQKKTTEHIFDILYDNFSKKKANDIIQCILDNY